MSGLTKKGNVTGSEAAGGVALLKGVAPLHFRLAAFRAVKRTIQTKMAATAPPPVFNPVPGGTWGTSARWVGRENMLDAPTTHLVCFCAVNMAKEVHPIQSHLTSSDHLNVRQ